MKNRMFIISVLEAAGRDCRNEDIPLEQVSHLIFDVNLRYALSSTGYVTTHDLYCAESIDVTNETVYTLQEYLFAPI